MLTNNFCYAYQILSVNQNRFCLFLVDVPKVLYSSIIQMLFMVPSSMWTFDYERSWKHTRWIQLSGILNITWKLLTWKLLTLLTCENSLSPPPAPHPTLAQIGKNPWTVCAVSIKSTRYHIPGNQVEFLQNPLQSYGIVFCCDFLKVI